MVSLSEFFVADCAYSWDNWLSRHIRHVASKRLIVRISESVQLRFKPWNVTLCLFVAHPKLGFAYLVAQVP